MTQATETDCVQITNDAGIIIIGYISSALPLTKSDPNISVT